LTSCPGGLAATVRIRRGSIPGNIDMTSALTWSMPGARIGAPATVPKKAAGAPRSHARTKLACAALAVGLCIPSQVILPIEVAKITAMRAFLLVLIIPAFFAFLRALVTKRRRLRVSDALVGLTSFWIMAALTTTEGLEVSIVSGVLAVMELAGGYLLMRAFVNSRSDVEIFVSTLAGAMVFLVMVAVFDHLSGQNFVTETLSRLTGRPTNETQYRHGFLRARAMLDHAILFGTLSAFAAVVLSYGLRSAILRVAGLGLCMFGVLLAMSSAPLIALVLALGVMTYDRLMGSYAGRWRLLLVAIGSAVLLLLVIRDDPIRVILRNFTLDPATGYYRLLIWEYAGAEALSSPWVGIGFRDWSRMSGMSGSVDSLWLVLAMVYGIPCSVLLAATVLSAMWRSGPVVPERFLDPYLTRMRTGLSIVLCLAIVVGFTVHLWAVMWTLLGALTGLRTTLEEMRSAEAERVLRQRANEVRHPRQGFRSYSPITRIPPNSPLPARARNPRFRVAQSRQVGRGL
jgi:hypothetical protein